MKFPYKNTVIVIAGPTAVGKTALSIKVARRFNTAIISADSRQCYREMTIGTAKPGIEELEIVPHYFINSHSIQDNISAGQFEQLALEYVQDIFQEGKIAVMCGGTGLYIRAFCKGMDTMPGISPVVRARIRENFQKKGLNWLQKEVKEKDPAFYAASTELQNPQRLMRALECWEATGKSIIHYRSGGVRERPFNILKIGLELPRETLRERINLRVDQMIRDGLMEEAKDLLPYRHLNALQTVGYKEIFEHLDGKLSLSQAIEAIKINTCKYAKRQMTWFRKEDMNWFDARDEEAVLRDIENSINKKD